MKKRRIESMEDVEYVEVINNAKQRDKFVKRVERIVRSSMEYKDYIQYITKYMDMGRCAFFLNAGKTEDGRGTKVAIERHHAPLTLYDIVNIVLEKWIQNGDEINALLIASEVTRLHYQGKVGLIPLSKTIHKLYHNTDLIKIPLWLVSDGYIDFLEEYEDYWTKINGIEDKLKRAIEDSNSITEDSFKHLVANYEYLEIKGQDLPRKLEIEEPIKIQEEVDVREKLFSVA